MSEKNFWALVRGNLDLNMYRVENRVSAGMPDIHYIDNGITGWIELKYMENFPKKGRMRVGLKLHQSFWHNRYNDHGGKTWILIRIGRVGTYLVDGKHSDKIQKRPSPYDLLRMCSWKKRGNLTIGDWKGLKNVIIGKDKSKNKNWF